MSITTFANLKGGSGKSNAVKNFAVSFALNGYTVAIADADLAQQHSAKFFTEPNPTNRDERVPRSDIPDLTVAVYDKRAGIIPPQPWNILVAPQVDQETIAETLQRLGEAVDVVLCDLQGSASVAMLHAFLHSDLVIIPVQPSGDDLDSAVQTVGHLRSAARSRRRDIPFRLLLSRASTGFMPEVEKVTVDAFRQANLPMLKTPLFERTAFKRMTFARVAPVFENKAGGAAANIAAVYAELRSTLAEVVAESAKAVEDSHTRETA